MSVPVPILRRVEARTPKDGPALLVGVTTVGNVVFAGRWSPQELAADAETLNGFLSDASRPAWTRTYDHRPDGAFVMKLSAILGPLLLLVVVGARPWRVTANIRRGVVTRTTRVWRRRRPLSSFTAVQVRSALDEKIEKLRRDGGRMPYALLSSARTVRIVLLERSGRSWPITMSTTPAQLALDLETIARRFADAVGVPFVPAAPHPPPGALLGVDLTLLPGAPLQLPVSADDDRRP